jgi:N-acetylglucosaminyldiphosphoundecaprenol N-acetyl-beta-D-mannosaminyltransferase
VNSLALLQRRPELARFYSRADLVFIDGMAVVLLGRLLRRPFRREHRLAELDFMDDVFAVAEREGWRVAHLGSAEPVLGRARLRVLRRFPRLDLLTVGGYFDPAPGGQENERVLQELRAYRPDLLLVGMGMPRQELWLDANAHALPPCVVLTVGGLFGYLGGDRPTAPRVLGRWGLEWAFRLATEPGRLWRRYLVEPWVLTRPLLAELMQEWAR